MARWYWQGHPIRLPESAVMVLQAELLQASRERTLVFFLDAHCCLLDKLAMPWGDGETAPFYLDRLLHEIERLAPAYVIVGHNHLVGGPEPSLEDLALTGELSELLACHRVRLLDHLILYGPTFYSLRRAGLVPAEPAGLFPSPTTYPGWAERAGD